MSENFTIPTIDRALKVLYLRGGVTTQSNFARENAVEVAALASLGRITTRKDTTEVFGNVWRITSEGLLKLTEKGLL